MYNIVIHILAAIGALTIVSSVSAFIWVVLSCKQFDKQAQERRLKDTLYQDFQHKINTQIDSVLRESQF